MRRKIELYINGSLADLDKQDFILMNYALTDIQKPTAVKNSFSKQVTLPGTPANDAIFSHAFRLDRVVMNLTFNPLVRTSFQIMNDAGEILQSGYIKLDRIDKKQDSHSYTVTLYGGLGSFLYELTYSDSGEKLSLADLTYKIADASFYFTINKGAIYAAWDRLVVGDYSPIYDIINFVPCYNGLPDKFDSNKARLQSDYNTVVELSRKFNEWETRDLRSYLQRPAVRVEEVLSAINTFATAKGKTITWDADFFNVNNPYYRKSYMLLPMLTSFEDSTAGQVGDTSSVRPELQTHAVAEVPMGGTVYLLGNTFQSGQDGSIDFSSFDPSCSLKGEVYSEVQFRDANNAAYPGFLNYYDTNTAKWKGTLLAVQAYARVGTGAGMTYAITKPYIFGQWNGNTDPRLVQLLSMVDTSEGYTAGGNEIGVASFALQAHANFQNIAVSANNNVAIYLSFCAVSDDATSGEDTFKLYQGERNSADPFAGSFKLYTTGGLFSLNKPASAGSNVTFTKSMLLSNTCTPADFLLSFCRQFGLKIIETEPNKISILSPNNFYTGDTEDLTKMIDRSAIKVQPLTFNKKWQKLGLSIIQSGKAIDYKKEYGKEYGVLNLDTGLEFNAETEDLMSGSAFKGGVSGRWSNYTLYDFLDINLNWINPALVFGYTDGDGYHNPQIYDRTPLNALHEGYDLTTKPFGFTEDRNEQKAVDLGGLLVFYNGYVSNPGMFWITDDYPAASQNPCWQMPTMQDSYSAKVTYLPVFSRYYETTQGTVSHSMDFGTPLEIYDPDVNLPVSASIYTRYWKEYLEDLYDKSGKVMTAKVHFFGKKVGPELFRRFYYYEGSIWVLNKITNYSLTTYDPVECEFVQVKKKTNYTDGQKIIDEQS